MNLWKKLLKTGGWNTFLIPSGFVSGATLVLGWCIWKKFIIVHQTSTRLMTTCGHGAKLPRFFSPWIQQANFLKRNISPLWIYGVSWKSYVMCNITAFVLGGDLPTKYALLSSLSFSTYLLQNFGPTETSTESPPLLFMKGEMKTIVTGTTGTHRSLQS